MNRRALALLLFIGAGLQAQTHARRDVVKGRVTTDSGGPVFDADVIVTMAPTREVVRSKSDSSGNYTLTLDQYQSASIPNAKLYSGAAIAGTKAFSLE